MGDLGPKLMYAGVINEEEKIRLGLFGKTGSIESKFSN